MIQTVFCARVPATNLCAPLQRPALQRIPFRRSGASPLSLVLSLSKDEPELVVRQAHHERKGRGHATQDQKSL
jgi:hypothetical protein